MRFTYKQRWKRLPWRQLFRRSLWTALVATAIFATCWVALPFRSQRLQYYSDTVYLRDCAGTPLRTLLGADELKCDPVDENQISPWAGMALIAAEDKRFYSHPGVDVAAIARASSQNLTSASVISGASTLSTQIIRMTTPRSRNIGTKLIEAFRALQMERKVTKDEILTQYLNRAPFGSNIMGIEAASRFYFGKSSAHLSLAEASLLMGLPQSPSRFRPDRQLAKALKRRDYVLNRMLSLGMISTDALNAAQQQPLAIGSHPESFAAPHFCDWVSASRPLKPGNCNTTLNAELQAIAEAELRRQSETLKQHGVDGGAVVIIEVKSGAVRALVGSPDYADPHGGQVNGACSPRSPGSTLKPFAFAQAFDRGLYTPDTVLGDVPMQFKEYTPRNADREYRGLVTVRDALIESLNMPAIQTVQALGLDAFAQQLRQLGLRNMNHPASHYGVSLVLGTAEFSLIDMANAYACLAREGRWMPYRLLEAEPARAPNSLFSCEAAWFVSHCLGGEERSLAFCGHAADVHMPRVAWKTGTSNGYRDAWTLGYNPDYVVGVWMGNPRGEGSAALVGIDAAAPIVARIFRRLYPEGGGPWFDRPSALKKELLCQVSGHPVGPHCPTQERGWVNPGVTRMAPCPIHRLLPHERETGKRLSLCELSGRDVSWRVGEIWPQHIAAYLNGKQQSATITQSIAAISAPTILSPMNGSTLRLPSHPRDTQPAPIPLKARYSQPNETLYWFANNHFIGSTRADKTLYWNAAAGSHEIRCTTAAGGIAVASIQIEKSPTL